MMKNFYKLLLSLIFIFLLGGCAITPIMQNTPAKNKSISVVSFLGNEARYYSEGTFLGKMHKYKLQGVDLDSNIIESIKAALVAEGIKNVHTYKTPKDNSIANETLWERYLRLSDDLTSTERNYLHQLISGKHFDYLIAIMPGIAKTNDCLIYKYGIYDDRSIFKPLTSYYAVYCVYVFKDRTLNPIAVHCNHVYSNTAGLSLNWNKNFPKMTYQQKKLFQKQLLIFIRYNVAQTVLETLGFSKQR